MIDKHRITVVAACALAALASGCRNSGGDRRLQDLPLLPYTRVPTELIADVGAPGSVAQGWRDTLVRSTPGWEQFEGNTLLPGRLDQVQVSVTNLGLPLLVGLPWLPLWTQIERRSWPRGHEGRMAPRNQIVTLTPFTSDLMEWDVDDDEDYPRLDVSGLSLLYRRVSLAGDAGQTNFGVVTTLWSLGPWWSSFDVRETGYELSVLWALTLFGPQVSEEPGTSGWIVEPLGLAGLGHWLWSSRAWSGPGDDEGWRHGPLGGWLGWAHDRSLTTVELIGGETRTQDRPSAYDLVLGGALWFSYLDIERDSWNGPLWGMFGWGTDRGAPCLRLLWLPIPL